MTLKEGAQLAESVRIVGYWRILSDCRQAHFKWIPPEEREDSTKAKTRSSNTVSSVQTEQSLTWKNNFLVWSTQQLLNVHFSTLLDWNLLFLYHFKLLHGPSAWYRNLVRTLAILAIAFEAVDLEIFGICTALDTDSPWKFAIGYISVQHSSELISEVQPLSLLQHGEVSDMVPGVSYEVVRSRLDSTRCCWRWSWRISRKTRVPNNIYWAASTSAAYVEPFGTIWNHLTPRFWLIFGNQQINATSDLIILNIYSPDRVSLEKQLLPHGIVSIEIRFAHSDAQCHSDCRSHGRACWDQPGRADRQVTSQGHQLGKDLLCFLDYLAVAATVDHGGSVAGISRYREG